ncbi:uncharacterized protein FA14DRAFT_125500 [Meira miltonrushii]|uniref:GH26 domain-containing protein n=1 Tax=Meira miltonrushii TaxID=1280837 RepID=A0A316V4F5_9BASI|nr:uncharacterized protein FA14DRAFT_125500 [Meira miltonrushii]PWN32426.1 hypothetical protein FA14DRAFT_125500 [Meira miltonrushii]
MVCLLLCSKPVSGRSIRTDTVQNTTLTFKLNDLPIGFIPQHDASPTPMADINTVLSQGAKGVGNTYRSATFGWYAQVYPGLPFKGEQLLKIKDDVIKSGAIFEIAIMPLRSYDGFTAQDPSQAIAVAKVLQQFTQAGVQVRLRFGHEMNYYGNPTRGEYIYSNDTGAFKEAFKQMSIAAKQYCQDKAQMVFNPNSGSLAEIDSWAPDPSTYSMIALDYYAPSRKSLSVANYLSVVQPFYQKYGQNGSKQYIIAETSLQYNSTIDDRLRWLLVLSDPKIRQTLKSLQSLTWFNLNKDFPFEIVYPPSDPANAPLIKMVSSSMNKRKPLFVALRRSLALLFLVSGLIEIT